MIIEDYEKMKWSESTPVTKENLNHMDEGIFVNRGILKEMDKEIINLKRESIDKAVQEAQANAEAARQSKAEIETLSEVIQQAKIKAESASQAAKEAQQIAENEAARAAAVAGVDIAKNDVAGLVKGSKDISVGDDGALHIVDKKLHCTWKSAERASGYARVMKITGNGDYALTFLLLCNQKAGSVSIIFRIWYMAAMGEVTTEILYDNQYFANTKMICAYDDVGEINLYIIPKYTSDCEVTIVPLEIYGDNTEFIYITDEYQSASDISSAFQTVKYAMSSANPTGNLTALQTSAKNNIVDAVNEVWDVIKEEKTLLSNKIKEKTEGAVIWKNGDTTATFAEQETESVMLTEAPLHYEVFFRYSNTDAGNMVISTGKIPIDSVAYMQVLNTHVYWRTATPVLTEVAEGIQCAFSFSACTRRTIASSPASTTQNAYVIPIKIKVYFS